MKFQQPSQFKKWTKEQTENRIEFTKSEIALMASDINNINSKISGLIEERLILQRKIGNKSKYINQLKEQLKEYDSSSEAQCAGG